MRTITLKTVFFDFLGLSIGFAIFLIIIGLVISSIAFVINGSGFQNNMETTFGIAIIIQILPIVFGIIFTFEVTFSKYIKIYNQVCVSPWREDLLQLGFTEKLGKIQNSINQSFSFIGLYREIPFTIGSKDYNHKYIEVAICLSLNTKKEEDFEKFDEGLRFDYSQKIALFLTTEKLYTRISTDNEIKSEEIWTAMNELIEIANTEMYGEQKLISYATENSKDFL